MTVRMAGNNGLLTALQTLRRELGHDLFPLVIGDVAAHRRDLKELIGQLDDYLLPRVAAMDAPLLAVVGGSTGAGKSTLVNSLARADVTEPGVLRPTTLAPTLVANPADEAWFTEQHVLPGLARTTGGGRGEPGTLRIVTAGTLPEGLALLDAPDIDSVVTANREMAAQLLAAADLWLFVTTASRYADEVPWGFLRNARERSMALAVVLDRVPVEARDAVSAHLHRLLDANGLAGTPVFSVPEVLLPQENGRLPDDVVRAIRAWLADLADDAQARADVVRRTLSGALESLTLRVPALAEEVDRQRAGIADLRRSVDGAYGAAMATFDDGIRDGSLLRGEVLTRWQDFIGTGDFMRSLESRIGWLRERIVSAFTGRPAPDAQLRVALETGVESLIRSAADAAAERALEAWTGTPAGRDVLERAGVVTAGRLGRASATLNDRAAAAVRAWQGYVLQLVAKEGAEKRTTARVASFSVNGAGLLLMLMVFASTGGLTGLEVGIAGGTSVLSQKILEAVFGDQAVRTLTQAAREDLLRRVREVLDEESARFTALVETVGPSEETSAALRQAAQGVRDHSREIGALGTQLAGPVTAPTPVQDAPQDAPQATAPVAEAPHGDAPAGAQGSRTRPLEAPPGARDAPAAPQGPRDPVGEAGVERR
ncbi:ABC transporter [Sphaerisporangium sp. TRM90804]|uniref:ABC transporter n=1 Tax=Sphaerisporangium sp. TRM90804 TaxID=3031113 RepID=UPI00244A4BE0|nr:ABC transporter [Sphaerisporangium sp. TRM90804]MDH2430375.1 ABC transporter [Sphaerisporangium sp. TRM90804]